MLRLEDVTHGMTIAGIVPDGPAVVVEVKWLGTSSVELRYQDAAGKTGVRLLSRSDEEALELLGSVKSNLFTGNSAAFRLAAEAVRFRFAHLFDPFLGFRTSLLEALPHQVHAVYRDLLLRHPIRYLFADAPGAGKKITTGLLIKELMLRGEVRRCLVVCPGTAAEAWQDELLGRFELAFDIVPADQLESARAFKTVAETNLAIARLELLSRDIETKLRLDRPEWTWDLVVIDQAHRLPASFVDGEPVESERFRLCRLLSQKSRHLVLLSPMPHDGNEQEFQLLLSLLDPDRFEGPYREGIHATGASDLGRRLPREQLFWGDGSRLYHDLQVRTRLYSPSEAERRLQSLVTSLARRLFDLADRLSPERREPVRLAVSLLLRRLTSSPEAIFQALYHRRKRLEALLTRAEALKTAAFVSGLLEEVAPVLTAREAADIDDLPPGEREPLEERLLDMATPARSLAELRAEIAALKDAETIAKEIFRGTTDSKWADLRPLLEYENLMFDGSGDRRKLLVLTEHKDSLDYAAAKISSLLARPGSVVTLHAGLSREARRSTLERFRDDARACVLVATDGTLEGTGFLGAHLLVNWDLPWSAARLSRRFSMLFQPGQAGPCVAWNLVSAGTVEGGVFEALFSRHEEETALGGPGLLTTLEALFRTRPLDQLIVQTLRSPEAVASAGSPSPASPIAGLAAGPSVSVFNKALAGLVAQEKARLVLEERGLPGLPLPAVATETWDELTSGSSTALPPRAVESFVSEALEALGGTLRPAEPGRFEVPSIPDPLRLQPHSHAGSGLPDRYNRICFDAALSSVAGFPWASFVRPGHPLVRTLVDTLLNQNRETLRLGAALVDPGDFEGNVRVLFFLEQTVVDGRRLEGGARGVVARAAGFAEIGPNGQVADTLLDSYLRFRAPSAEERPAVDRILLEPWLWEDLESRAVSHILSTVGTELLSCWRAVRESHAARTREAVKSRMQKEVAYWDRLATSLTGRELAEKEKTSRPAQAAKKAEILGGRLQRRIAEIEEGRIVSVPPPGVVCRAVIVPIGLLRRLQQAAKSVTLAR